MPVGRVFQAKLSLRSLFPIANSVGAHIAAKLEQFSNDERTLTDELCDMFCVWSKYPTPPMYRSIPQAEKDLIAKLPPNVLDMTFNKIGPSDEAEIGADLEIILTTPSGTKWALFQAKVQDPIGNIRRSFKEDWRELRNQLKNMKYTVGDDMSFLLLYVPERELDSASQGYPTWEQNLSQKSVSTRSSKFGATVIPVNALIGGVRDTWRTRAHVEPLGQGMFRPSGISLTRVLFEMLVCKRGAWGTLPQIMDATPKMSSRRVPYRTFSISINDMPLNSWEGITEIIKTLLDSDQIL